MFTNVCMNIFILEAMVYIHDHISTYLGCVGEKRLSPGKMNAVHSVKKKDMKIIRTSQIFKDILNLCELL